MRQKVSMVVYKMEQGKPHFLVARRPDSKIIQYPTGTCEENEGYLDCAFREVKEELGDVTILNFTDLNKSFNFTSDSGRAYEEHVVAFEIDEVVNLQKEEFDSYEFLDCSSACKKVNYDTHRKNLELVNDIIIAKDYTKFIIFVAPTACGKSVIIKTLLDKYPNLFERVKTYMTREFKRAEDSLLRIHVSHEEFEQLDKKDKLIEKNFHDGNWYGSSYDLIESSLKSGKNILAEVDINGLNELQKHFHNIISIFINAPLDEIEFRLRERGGHNNEEVSRRLVIAQKEIARKDECSKIITNKQGELEKTLEEVEDFLLGVVRR